MLARRVGARMRAENDYAYPMRPLARRLAGAEMTVGNLSESITVTGDSPLVDTQSTRRETVIKAETLQTLPATRGYGSIIATVPALNIGGVAGAGATTAPTTPEMMFFTAHGGDSGEGRVMTNGLTVASPFGGGGVSGVTAISRRSSAGLRSRTLRPPIRMSPSVISTIRLAIRIAVVFPQPEGPTRTQISPAGTSRLSPSTAGRSAPTS